MKKLLVSYDGSAQADAALDDLAHAGLPSTLEAMTLCVADVWLPPGGPTFEATLPPPAQRSYDQALQAVGNAKALAEKAAARLRMLFPGWNVQAQSCADSPPWAVVKQAETWGADLVLVGAHSHSALQRLFLGSVASKVVAEAPCSVRAARPRSHPQHPELRLLVAVDGSNDSVNTINAVAARSWPSHCQCRVVTVIDPKLQTASAWPGLYAESWVLEHAKGVEEWTCRMTEHLAGVLRKAGCPAETHIYEGDPKKVLLEQAEDWKADCIFLGARGLHHGDRMFLGSLASAVAGRAHCTVEIVRQKPGAAPRSGSESLPA